MLSSKATGHVWRSLCQDTCGLLSLYLVATACRLQMHAAGLLWEWYVHMCVSGNLPCVCRVLRGRPQPQPKACITAAFFLSSDDSSLAHVLVFLWILQRAGRAWCPHCVCFFFAICTCAILGARPCCTLGKQLLLVQQSGVYVRVRPVC